MPMKALRVQVTEKPRESQMSPLSLMCWVAAHGDTRRTITSVANRPTIASPTNIIVLVGICATNSIITGMIQLV